MTTNKRKKTHRVEIGLSPLKYEYKIESETESKSDEAQIAADFNDYNECVKKIYEKHLQQIQLSVDLCHIYGQCGNIYEEILNLNLTSKRWNLRDHYDHYLVFCIAGWLKDNVKHRELEKLTQNEIATNITEQIIKWASSEDRYNKKIQEIYVKYLHNIPLSPDLSYVYGQCGKVYEEICSLNISWKR